MNFLRPRFGKIFERKYKSLSLDLKYEMNK